LTACNAVYIVINIIYLYKEELPWEYNDNQYTSDTNYEKIRDFMLEKDIKDLFGDMPDIYKI